MKHSSHPRRCAAVLCIGLCIVAASEAQAPQGAGGQQLLAALSELRLRGCAGQPGASVRLRQVASLDETARRMAGGAPAVEASRSSGYRAKTLFHAHMSGYPRACADQRSQGPATQVRQQLLRSGRPCEAERPA